MGRPLRELKFPGGAIAIMRASGEVRVPRGEAQIAAGDRVILFTLESNVQHLEAAFLAPRCLLG